MCQWKIAISPQNGTWDKIGNISERGSAILVTLKIERGKFRFFGNGVGHITSVDQSGKIYGIVISVNGVFLLVL